MRWAIGHPAIEDAIENRAEKLIHISNLFFHEGQAELAAAPDGDDGPGSRLLFEQRHGSVGSCAEAGARSTPGCRAAKATQIGTKFLALENSFHGRTMGSVSTTHKAKYREPFAPVMPGVEFVAFNDVAASAREVLQ